MLARARSIRTKLNAIIAATTTIALAIAAIALLLLDLQRGFADARQDVLTQADVIGLASAPAVAFADRAAAIESLSVLRARSNVVAAALYDEQGSLFASYQRDESGNVVVPEKTATMGVRLEGDHAVAWRPVLSSRQQVGTIWLQVRHDRVWLALQTVAMLAGVMFGSLGAALLLSNRLQRAITGPILDISEVARTILRDEGGSNDRATRRSNDEVGDLVDAFNSMLDELERRSQTLEVANRALKDSETRYQLAVRGSSAGLWDWDMVAGTVFFSPRIKSMLGLTETEFINHPSSVLATLFVEDRRILFEKLKQHLRERVPFSVECRKRDQAHDMRWYLIAGSALWDDEGRPYRMAGSMVEVTERKEAERVLRESSSAKDKFLATLAHELRNPLAPIRTGLDILRLDTANGRESEEARCTMERQLGHMVRLIDDLMDISRISSGKIRLNISRARLLPAMDAALEISQPAIASGGQTLTVDLPSDDIELMGDPTRIAQAVGNLLNNAAKYTPPGGRITLRLRREADEAVIEVEDDGEGIPAEMLDGVFSLFAQARATVQRSQGGLGIGLYLVRSLVELHGGTVVAHSAGSGQGSAFAIRLPCLEAATRVEALPDAAGHRAPPSGLKVLLVDDNVDAANTLSLALEMWGCSTSVLHEGTAVVEEARSFEPDAVLLDIGLPGLNGYEVATALRREARFASTLMVAVTGWGSPQDRLRARAAGFDRHLTKPVELAELEPILREVRPGNGNGLAMAEDKTPSSS